jgi:hypothetical protein
MITMQMRDKHCRNTVKSNACLAKSQLNTFTGVHKEKMLTEQNTYRRRSALRGRNSCPRSEHNDAKV